MPEKRRESQNVTLQVPRFTRASALPTDGGNAQLAWPSRVSYLVGLAGYETGLAWRKRTNVHPIDDDKIGIDCAAASVGNQVFPISSQRRVRLARRPGKGPFPGLEDVRCVLLRRGEDVLRVTFL